MEKVEKKANTMQKQMEKTLKISLILVALIAVALVAAFWAISVLHQSLYQPFNPLRPMPPPPMNPEDYEFFYIAKAVVSSVNIALLALILIMNINIFRKTGSKFTFGLLIFSVAFLLKDLTASPLTIWAFGYQLVGLGPFALLPDLFELVVLSVLLYLSFE